MPARSGVACAPNLVTPCRPSSPRQYWRSATRTQPRVQPVSSLYPQWVVERCRCQNDGIVDAGLYAKHRHQCNRVVYIWARIMVLPPLHAMLAGRKLNCSYQQADVIRPVGHYAIILCLGGANQETSQAQPERTDVLRLRAGLCQGARSKTLTGFPLRSNWMARSGL